MDGTCLTIIVAMGTAIAAVAAWGAKAHAELLSVYRERAEHARKIEEIMEGLYESKTDEKES